MKNFSNTEWIKALDEIDFTFSQTSTSIEEEATNLSVKINNSLDKCAPLKTFKTN